jgi:protein N-terminal methyltransferase
VSHNFLLKIFERVDLVEQNPKFLDEARRSFAGKEGLVDRYISVGLQNFCPEEHRYDLIWCQWVLGHLTDGLCWHLHVIQTLPNANVYFRPPDDLIAFLQRCKKGIKPNGMIGIKENIATVDYEVDPNDSSVTRSDSLLQGLFAKAGLTLLKDAKQNGFPSNLYSVKMYLLF